MDISGSIILPRRLLSAVMISTLKHTPVTLYIGSSITSNERSLLKTAILY